MVVTPQAIYAVSPGEKTVSVVYSVTGEHLLGFSYFSIRDKSSHDRGTIQIALTNKHLYIFPREATWRPTVTLSLEGLDLNKHLFFQQSIDGRYFVLRQSDPVAPTFHVFDATGKPISTATYDIRSTLDLPHKLNLPTYPIRQIPELSRSAQVIAAFGEGFKGVIWQVYQQYTLEPWERGGQLNLLYLEGVVLATLLAVVAAGLVAWKLHMSRLPTLAWVLAAALFGPLTLLVFAGIASRLPYEKCFACGRQRPTSQRLCPNCGAAPAMRPLTSAEIFA